MIEQTIETRGWKEYRGLTGNSTDCVKKNERQCNVFRLDAKCLQAANIWQGITVFMMMDVARGNKQNLLDQNVKWHQEKCNRGMF